MWSRVDFGAIAPYVGILGFLLTFGAFLYFVVRVIRMDRKKKEHLENLPFEGDMKKSDQNDS